MFRGTAYLFWLNVTLDLRSPLETQKKRVLIPFLPCETNKHLLFRQPYFKHKYFPSIPRDGLLLACTCREQAEATVPTYLSYREPSCQQVSPKQFLELQIFSLRYPQLFLRATAWAKKCTAVNQRLQWNQTCFKCGRSEKEIKPVQLLSTSDPSSSTQQTVTCTPPLPKVLYPRKRGGTGARKDTALKTWWSSTVASS